MLVKFAKCQAFSKKFKKNYNVEAFKWKDFNAF